jgi:hypothetical protein
MTDHHLRPALAIPLLPLTCQAADWPQFRGPHRDNVSKGWLLVVDCTCAKEIRCTAMMCVRSRSLKREAGCSGSRKRIA